MPTLIPRNYTLALFASALLAAALLVTYHVHRLNNQLESVANVAGDIHARTISVLEEVINTLFHVTQTRLEDDSKAKFRSILPLFREAEISREKYLEAVDGKYDLGLRCAFSGGPGRDELFHFAAHREMDAFTTRMAGFLLEFGKDYGLSEDEIESKISRFREETSANFNHEWADLEDLPRQLATDLLYIDILTLHLNFLQDLSNMSTYRGCTFDAFFPVFNAESSYLLPGETLRAKVGVGSYSSSLNPDNVDLRINGQRLYVNPDGTADFSKVVERPGKHSLETSVRITNPLTGEVTTGEGRFTYRVQ